MDIRKNKTTVEVWRSAVAAAGVNALNSDTLTVDIVVGAPYGKTAAVTTIKEFSRAEAATLLSSILGSENLQSKSVNFSLVEKNVRSDSKSATTSETTAESAVDESEDSSEEKSDDDSDSEGDRGTEVESEAPTLPDPPTEVQVDMSEEPKRRLINMEDPFGSSVPDNCTYAWSNLLDAYATAGADVARRCYAFKTYHYYSANAICGMLNRILTGKKFVVLKNKVRHTFEQNSKAGTFDGAFDKFYNLNASIANVLHDRLKGMREDPNMSDATAVANVSDLFGSLTYYEDIVPPQNTSESK